MARASKSDWALLLQCFIYIKIMPLLKRGIGNEIVKVRLITRIQTIDIEICRSGLLDTFNIFVIRPLGHQKNIIREHF